ncbi:MAG: hypothetical protein EPN72_11945 [Nevskiaceae bacterium]|nr:MAG: hypothetical protein EPN63_01030 [Nevskiaceae bacterium]TBR71899.1 MAG: hypothetical protein EPN72_11945 [Nevskiaceae bacterium]HEU0277739.1 hypothetical protein [Rhodanobacteraceae bacterium]
MRRALALSLAVVLGACTRHSPALTVDALAHDPRQLYALRHRCALPQPRVDRATCGIADKAYAKRFFLGLGGPDEYQTLRSLPPIPESFESVVGHGHE